MSDDENKFHPTTTASSVLGRLGNGEADADFAREVNRATDAALSTGGKAKVTITLEIKPDKHHGLLFQAAVTAKIPKHPATVAIMHRGPGGSLLTQTEMMLGEHLNEQPRAEAMAGARTEPPKPKPVSGRLPIVPLKNKPAPAPLAGATPATPDAGDDAGEKDQ